MITYNKPITNDLINMEKKKRKVKFNLEEEVKRLEKQDEEKENKRKELSTYEERLEFVKEEAKIYMPESDIKDFYTPINLCRVKWFPVKSPSTLTIWCNTGKLKGINISISGQNRYKIPLEEVVNYLKNN